MQNLFCVQRLALDGERRTHDAGRLVSLLFSEQVLK